MSYKGKRGVILHSTSSETITLEFWYLPGCQASKSKMAAVRDIPKQHDV